MYKYNENIDFKDGENIKVDIYIVDIRDCKEYVDEEFLYDKFNIKKTISQKERRQSLFAKCLLFYILKNICKIKNSNIKIDTNKFGKPYIKGCNIHFSLSHSENLVCCALGKSRVGVDIQEMLEIDFVRICKRFFHRDEIGYIMKADLKEKTNKFFEIWSCKEAYIKMIGLGLFKKLNSFKVIVKNSKYIVIDEGKIQDVNLYLKNYQNNYKLAICTKEESIKFRNIDINEILREVKK